MPALVSGLFRACFGPHSRRGDRRKIPGGKSGAKNPEKNREEIARKQHGNNPEKFGGTLARKNSRRFFLRIFFPAQKINGQNFFVFCEKQNWRTILF